MTKVDVAKIKFEHWAKTFYYEAIHAEEMKDLEDAFRAGFEAGRAMEAAMWELARDGQEWEIGVDQNAFDHS